MVGSSELVFIRTFESNWEVGHLLEVEFPYIVEIVAYRGRHVFGFTLVSADDVEPFVGLHHGLSPSGLWLLPFLFLQLAKRVWIVLFGRFLNECFDVAPVH